MKKFLEKNSATVRVLSNREYKLIRTDTNHG
jgi:hypothetical protein